MPSRLKPVDVVIVGFGWTGALMARELGDSGLKLVALERGGDRDTDPDFQPGVMHDELRYAVHHRLMQDVSRQTITFRNRRDQTVLPMRQLGSFLPGSGVGGAGVHWNGRHWRFLPSDFELRSHISNRYGAGFIPPDMSIQDWGVTYDELEPFYDRFEYLCGTSGQAGNIAGRQVPGGNPFEGPRRRGYPTPPLKSSWAMVLFEDAARRLGFHPFPQPAANLSRPYTNPEGAAMGACLYCGFCEGFGCEVRAKASPQATLLPAIRRNPNFELRTNSMVLRVNLDGNKTRATGVTYLDARGQEVEQPADLVVLCAFALNNVHLLLLSGIGKPYDPDSGQGVVGRNYAYRIVSRAGLFFDNQVFNPFMGAGALAMCIDDFNGDNFDHAKRGFIGGGTIFCGSTGGRPIQYHPVPDGTPRWGAQWKKAVTRYYNRSCQVTAHGSTMAYRGNCLDLDPTYRDFYGRPLLRMTYDHQDNDIRMSHALTEVCQQIGKAMGARQLSVELAPTPYSIVPYQTTHNVGGATMGADPKTSAVNRYLQSWDVANLFVMGASAFPQNTGSGPTGTVGALTYWAADALRNRYLKSPGPLVPI